MVFPRFASSSLSSDAHRRVSRYAIRSTGSGDSGYFEVLQEPQRTHAYVPYWINFRALALKLVRADYTTPVPLVPTVSCLGLQLTSLVVVYFKGTHRVPTISRIPDRPCMSC